MGGQIVHADERALQRTVEARTFAERVVLRSSGERRARATHVVKILTSAIEHLNVIVAERKR